MKTPRLEIAAIIAEKTLHIENSELLAKQIAAYLLEQKRSIELESIMRDVLAYRQARGIVEADVSSAHELNNELLADIKALLKQHYPKAKQIVAHQSFDESVIGGLRINLSNEQLDMTLRAKLDKFSRLTTEGIQ